MVQGLFAAYNGDAAVDDLLDRVTWHEQAVDGDDDNSLHWTGSYGCHRVW